MVKTIEYIHKLSIIVTIITSLIGISKRGSTDDLSETSPVEFRQFDVALPVSDIPSCTNSTSILVSIVEKNSQLVSKLTLAETVEIVIQTSQFENNQSNCKKATIQLHILNHI